MIEPTDPASDDGWDEAEEENSDGRSGTSGSDAAAEDKAASGTPTDDDGEDRGDDDDGDDDDGDDGDDDEGDGDAKKKRRRRKRESEPFAAPDERAQQALDFVAKVVLEMEMDCRVRLRRPKDPDEVDEVNIEIIGRDAGRIIGKKGSVLQAIQFLTHR